jgi:hypothetical protein
MTARTQITLDPEIQRRAQAKAAELGISLAEYVRRLVADDLGGGRAKPDISIMFDLGASGEPTDIARDKDKMIGEAVWEIYLRKAGRGHGAARKLGKDAGRSGRRGDPARRP